MSALPPFPLPDMTFEPLSPMWAAAAEDVFSLPRCAICAAFDWYPQGTCRTCGGVDIAWVPLSGRGSLFSWAEVHRALHPPLAALGSYVSAIVAIEEDPTVRFVTRLIDARLDRLRIDMPVRASFADLGAPAVETGVFAPLFTPANPEDRESI